MSKGLQNIDRKTASGYYKTSEIEGGLEWVLTCTVDKQYGQLFFLQSAILGGGFQHFLFSSLFEEDFHFD